MSYVKVCRINSFAYFTDLEGGVVLDQLDFVLVKKYIFACHPYKEHGCSEALVGMLYCMVVKDCHDGEKPCMVVFMVV